MSLADEIEAIEAKGTGVPSGACSVCWWLAKMSQDDREAVETGKISTSKLAEVLTRNGYPTSPSSVKRHRNRHSERPTS